MDGPAHTFRLRPSGTLLATRVVAHVAGLIACASMGSPALGAVLSLLVASSLFRELRQHARARPLWLGREAEGWWIEEAGRRVPVEVLGESRVWPGCVGLCVRESPDARRRWLMLAPDSASPGDLRRLRVALRVGGRPSGREHGVEGLR